MRKEKENKNQMKERKRMKEVTRQTKEELTQRIFRNYSFEQLELLNNTGSYRNMKPCPICKTERKFKKCC